VELPLGEPSLGRSCAHGPKDTIGSVVDVRSFMRNPFSFLFARSSAEERVLSYVIREHHRGRSLTEIMHDRYVQNRLTPQQQSRLLDRTELIQAVGDDVVESARDALPGRV
jgi:hypothetical protein